MKYKVGDQVLIQLVIEEVDDVDGSTLPYRGSGAETRDMWFSPRDIFALVDDGESQVRAKFKPGDWVIHKNKPEWGLGTILKGDLQDEEVTDFWDMGSDPFVRRVKRIYRVHFTHKQRGDFDDAIWLTAEQNLTEA